MRDKIQAEIRMYENLIENIDKEIEELKQNKKALDAHIVVLEHALAELKIAPSITKPLKTFLKVRKDARANKIIKFIKQMERPVTLEEICSFLWPNGYLDKQKDSLRGNITQYVLDRHIFVKVAPTTYGLLELGHKEQGEVNAL